MAAEGTAGDGASTPPPAPVPSVDSVPPPGPVILLLSGDRSHVGKSSVCLGLIASAVRLGLYSAEEIGYMKPCTQCEAPGLVGRYCREVIGMDAESVIEVGPVVYYKGFTREHLAGRTEGTPALLSSVRRAVASLSARKKMVVLDGVGYPSVGSITGTDNASVAAACGNAPVLLIGRGGVGDAIDSFNINASYFEARGVPVVGAIFNRVATTGYYSVENCREAVGSYFQQNRPMQTPFGFVAEVQGMETARDDSPGSLNQAMASADSFVNAFIDAVDVPAIFAAAADASTDPAAYLPGGRAQLPSSFKKMRINTGGGVAAAAGMPRGRRDIEAEAAKAGAVGG